MVVQLSGLTVVACSAIYRLIELSDGWNGKVISTQWLFSKWPLYFIARSFICMILTYSSSTDVFDGAMVVLAMITLAVLHPGYLLY